MTFENWLKTSQPDLKTQSIQAVLALANEGATIPFIARYRKEQTGNLDEVAIQHIIEGFEKWGDILKRQTFIKEEIERQEKLTPELSKKILSTFSLEALEDVYLPFKLKRKTKATKAKEAGLEPLAELLWSIGKGLTKVNTGDTLESLAKSYVNKELGVADPAAALDGASHIVIERLSENAKLRDFVRQYTFQNGYLRSEKGAKVEPHSKYEKYFTFEEKIQSLSLPQNSHRYLAMRRGWTEEELKLAIGGRADDETFDKTLLSAFEHEACPVKDALSFTVLHKAARLALRAHVQTSIDSEVHQALKTSADEAAIKVFSENVRKLLLAAPFGSKAVLGVDPGIRTGCKIAVINDAGQFLATTVMYTQTSEQKKQAAEMLKTVLTTQNIRAIAVGNGTAGRETESFLREVVNFLGLKIAVVMVNESGASVYSASDAAREEFPNLDLTVRGAISIARRLQDPLAELVKVDPKSIGVGQYQHDVSPTLLKKNLDLVVDVCVNGVGVNLNTASYHLLSRVSGIGPGLAKTIVEHRGKKGLFKSRKDLLEVTRFTQKVFELAAGFLRVPESENPLDNTGIHPERYEILETLAKEEKKKVSDFVGSGVQLLKKRSDLRLKIGDYTFDDIVKELEKPGRDPRESFVSFQFREDIHEVKDLKPGLICPGIVTNVTNFGAFVDIGVHQDGLVHISQLADKFVKDPREVVSPGDHVSVRVLEINLDKNQIALTMKREVSSHVGPKSPPESRSQREPRGSGNQNKGVSFHHNPFAVLSGVKGPSDKK